MTGDSLNHDLTLVEEARKLFAHLNLKLPRLADLEFRKAKTEESPNGEQMRTAARSKLDERFSLPTPRSLPATMKAVSKVTTSALENASDRDRVVNLVGFWLIDLVSQGQESQAEVFLRYFARHRWFVVDAVHLADLAGGFARFDLAKLAAITYTLAFTRSRGGGGWLSLGDAKHVTLRRDTTGYPGARKSRPWRNGPENVARGVFGDRTVLNTSEAESYPVCSRFRQRRQSLCIANERTITLALQGIGHRKIVSQIVL